MKKKMDYYQFSENTFINWHNCIPSDAQAGFLQKQLNLANYLDTSFFLLILHWKRNKQMIINSPESHKWTLHPKKHQTK